MTSPHHRTSQFPPWLRYAAIAWLCLWLVVYERTWGVLNFLHLSDVSMILFCVGVAANSTLLISSQAVASLLVNAMWTLDTCWRLFLKHHLMGGTEYLFDTRYSLAVRLISLFHILIPLLLLWALYRSGYDRRGWRLQCAISLPAFIASRFAPAAENINFAFADPFFRRSWGPAPVHITVVFLFMVWVVYLPTHLVLKHLFPSPTESPESIERGAPPPA
jgi:hypothetical protein